MMPFNWTFGRNTEERARADTLADAVAVFNSQEPPGDVATVAALEAAAGTIGRAFAIAKVKPSDASLATSLRGRALASIGRELIRTGDVVFDVATRQFATSYEVSGGSADEDSWAYRFNLTVPDGSLEVVRRGDEVYHFRYASQPDSVRGVGPLSAAAVTGSLAVIVEKRLEQEHHQASVSVLPFTEPMGAASGTANAKALGAALGESKLRKGQLVAVKSQLDRQGYGRSSSDDWSAKRLGANTPATTLELRRDITESVLAACGIPATLYTSAGGGLREAWRAVLHGAILPLARIVEEEVRRKSGPLMPNFALDFSELQASDIQGRARALKSMIDAGVELERALTLCGFENNIA